MKRAVILGGGIGGVEAAIALAKKGVEVELVSERDYLFVYPLAIWIPTGERSLDQVSIKLTDIARAHGFEVTIDEVVGINAAGRSFTGANGGERRDFDYLVLAIGAAKMPHKGKEHVFSICGPPEESVQLRERLDALIAKGSGTIAVGFGGNPKDSSAVRGGPAFEFLLNLHHRLKRSGRPQELRSRLLRSHASARNPDGREGSACDGPDSQFPGHPLLHGQEDKRIHSKRGARRRRNQVDADLIMFITAGDGHGVVKCSDLPQNEVGFVLIDPACEVRGYPWLYAVGDVAALEGPEWKAKQGHMAEVMARIAAEDIVRKETGHGERGSYIDELAIICVMDMGNGAGFVYRNDKHAIFAPLPIVGHWIKRSWGRYYELRKLGKVPRMPGM